MVVDPSQAREANAQAFLKVPLYAAVYEKYIKEASCPRPPPLKKTSLASGWQKKQKSRARAVFEKAAEQAGYFEQGRNRLVRPGVAQGVVQPKWKDGGQGDIGGGGNSGGDDPPRHPLIEDLFQRLPPDGQS
jgi:hypothetical protein